MVLFELGTSYDEIEPRRSRSKFTFKHFVVCVTTAAILIVLTFTIVNVGRSREEVVLTTPGLQRLRISKFDGIHDLLLEEDTMVNTENGAVRGFKMVSREGREFLAFLGIPYAKPPVGFLRFQPPEDAQAWEGTINATEFKPDCMQSSPDGYRGEEDCLYLNIYSPKIRKRQNLYPVMVYVHGGIAGGSSKRNSGEYFMDEDVVLVGITYRVGILGNLNTNDAHARGNQGSRDIIKALAWIKQNIEQFGGNNQRVTLFGNSYGAMTISAILISPMGRGLFHQAILQSGTAIEPEFVQPNPSTQAMNLGLKLNCNLTTTEDLVTCFQNIDAGTLVTHSLEPVLQTPINDKIWENKFTASVDPKLNDVEDVFLPESPLKLLQRGNFQKFPLIIGLNSLEGLPQSTRILASSKLTRAFNEDWDRNAVQMLRLDRASSWNKAKSIIYSVRQFYFGNRNICEDTRESLTNMYTDRTYMHPAYTLASFYNRQHGSKKKQNVYLYNFDKFVVSSYLDRSYLPPGRYKREPSHADELQFLFPYRQYPPMPPGSLNEKFSKMMVRIWASFAQNGTPGWSDNNKEWLPIHEKPYRWIQLDSDPKMRRLHERRIKFWDSLNLSDIYL